MVLLAREREREREREDGETRPAGRADADERERRASKRREERGMILDALTLHTRMVGRHATRYFHNIIRLKNLKVK